MKKFVPLALCVVLTGCYTSPIKKEGIALGFQRVKTDDPAFLKADYGAKSKSVITDSSAASLLVENKPSAGTSASPLVAGAATGAAVAGLNTAFSSGAAALIGTAALPVLGVAAVGAATGALISAITPDTDCGDGAALFTLKTAEGEIKTIRQARRSVCEYKGGDVVRYLENETGILILRKQ